jgi:RNA polymerase sigma-70 factor (ECF subfamily)
LLKKIPNELIDGCRRSERLAQGRLFQLAVQDAARIIRGLGIAEADIDDVVQDVFVAVFRQLPGFEGRAAFSTWFFQCCLNTVRARRRKATRERWFRLALGELRSDEASPAPSARVDAARDAERIMARLSDKHREVLVLYEVGGLSGPEIADAIGIPLKTVWTRLFHARKNVAHAARLLGVAKPAFAEGES